MSTTVTSDDGRPTYEELSARVCELTAANSRLRADADENALVLESATDYAIISLNFTGQILNWNVGAHRLLGYTREEAVGRSGSIFFTAEDRANGVFIDELWNAFEHGSANNERWHVRRDGSRFWASGSMMPVLDTTGMVSGFLNIMRDRTRMVDAERHREFLLAEAQHKAKNTFATVYAVAARQDGTGTQAGPALLSRIAALARSHDLMELGDVTLHEVVERSLAPYGEFSGQARLAGPPVTLPGRIAAALNSTLHELATNAAKHGAFSVPDGQVEVTWATQDAVAGAPSTVVLLWRETGGPPVSKPSRRGFGTRVIEGRLIQEQGGGAVQLDFRPEGVTCRIQLLCAAQHQQPGHGSAAATACS